MRFTNTTTDFNTKLKTMTQEQENFKEWLKSKYGKHVAAEVSGTIYEDIILGYAKQAAIDALAKAERMEEIEQKEPNPFAVQSLDRYDSGELGELLDVVRMAINGKVPTKYESLDLWAYRLRDAMDIKRKQL